MTVNFTMNQCSDEQKKNIYIHAYIYIYIYIYVYVVSIRIVGQAVVNLIKAY